MTNADWQALLDADAGDATLRLQYSDWLEEHGRTEEAEAQRWLARVGKRPNPSGVDWEWWQEGAGQRRELTHRYLPAALFGHLPGAKCAYWGYPTRGAAEAGLVTAWRGLKEAGGPLP
jgi:uncharacterized protein (TIGR02996 family)